METVSVRSAPMRRSLLAACVLVATLSGCAARQGELVPPGTDRDELLAAIAAHGQDTSPDGIPPTQRSSVVASCANGALVVAEGTGYVALKLLEVVAQAGSNHGWH
jgi:hypothetical protein